MSEDGPTILAPEPAPPPPPISTPTGLALAVRFKGHLCAAVKSAVCRKPILLRRQAAEEPFLVPIEAREGEKDLTGERRARVACARAIRRTERARRKLQGDHLCRGTPTIERLLRDYAQTRRGKRWKIVAVKTS